MWLIPYFTTTGFFLSEVSDLLSRASASDSSRCFLAALSSGLRPRSHFTYQYLSQSQHSITQFSHQSNPAEQTRRRLQLQLRRASSEAR